MKPYRDLNDEEWERVMPLLPELKPRKEARGRPLTNTRAVLNGVLWVMFSGASWATMPRRYPSYQTCHRRFKIWHDTGVLRRVMQQLFGPSGDAFCEVITARMRSNRGQDKQKAAVAAAVVDSASRALASPLPAGVFCCPDEPLEQSEHSAQQTVEI